MWMIVTAILGHRAALAVALCFAAFQVWTAFRLRNSLNQQGYNARSLRSESAAIEAAPDEHGWLRWVARHFPPHGGGGLSRDDALNELDRRLADEPRYARLQRLAVGAPLVGVLITAFGFLNPPSMNRTETLGDIFNAVTPLILGVAYGALLALLNQFLLYICERQIDQVRSLGREWFDENIALGPSARGDENELAASMRDLAGELAHQLRAVESATNTVASGAGTLQQCLLTSSSQIEPLQSSLALFKSASDAATATFERITPIGAHFGKEFTEAVARFKETVDAHWPAVAKQHDEASGRLVQTATRAHEVMLKMEQAASAIEANSQSQRETVDEFHRSVIDAIIPHQDLALESLRRLDSLACGLSATMEAFNNSFNQFAENSAQLLVTADTCLRQLATTAGNLQSAVETQLEPAARLHYAVMAGIASTSDRAQQATEKLQDACAVLQTAASDHATAASELAKSVDSTVAPAHKLLAHATMSFDKTAEELAEHTDRLRSSLSGAATNLGALLPLARQAFSEMPNAVNEFRAVVNQKFEPAAQRHAEVVARIGSGVTGFNGLVGELQGATSELRRIVDAEVSAADAFRPACEAVQAAAGELKQVATSLRAAVNGDVLPAHQELRTAADSLRHSVDLLKAFIERGVTPATQRLQSLDATIASLQHIVNDLRPLAAIGRDASGLFEGVSRAADEIADLKSAVSRLDATLQPGTNGTTWWRPWRRRQAKLRLL